jgi:hypothetical protein
VKIVGAQQNGAHQIQEQHHRHDFLDRKDERKQGDGNETRTKTDDGAHIKGQQHDEGGHAEKLRMLPQRRPSQGVLGKHTDQSTCS